MNSSSASSVSVIFLAFLFALSLAHLKGFSLFIHRYYKYRSSLATKRDGSESLKYTQKENLHPKKCFLNIEHQQL
jgi:hypothetical protein